MQSMCVSPCQQWLDILQQTGHLFPVPSTSQYTFQPRNKDTSLIRLLYSVPRVCGSSVHTRVSNWTIGESQVRNDLCLQFYRGPEVSCMGTKQWRYITFRNSYTQLCENHEFLSHAVPETLQLAMISWISQIQGLILIRQRLRKRNW